MPTILLNRLVSMRLLAVMCCFFLIAPRAQAQQDAELPVVSLMSHPIGPGARAAYGYGTADPFQRELIRQAVLLAAREELGLATRDAGLGEPLARSASQGLVDYQLGLKHGEPVEVTLTIDGEPSPTHTVPALLGRLDGYPVLVQSAEAYSREGAVESLRACGFDGEPIPRAQAAPLPDSITRRQFDLDIVNQFFLVRDLHTLIRESGYNTDRLCALAMAYANLAQLSRYRMDFTERVFIARAMLYAGRAAALDPDRPEPHWALAYAWVMFDLPGFAMAEIEVGDGLNDAMGQPAERPGWVGLLETYHRYDTLALMAAAHQAGRTAQLAALLAAVSAETADAWGLQIAAIDLCNELNPDTVRGYHASFAATTWYLKNWEYPDGAVQGLTDSVPRLLLEHRAALPAAVVQKAREVGQERLWPGAVAVAQLAWALEDGTSPGDRHEPTDAALGHLIEGAVTTSAILYCSQVASRSNEYELPWDTIFEAVAREPYRNYIRICQYPVNSAARPKRDLLRRVTIGEFNMAVGVRLVRLRPQPAQYANLSDAEAEGWQFQQKSQNVADMYWFAKLYENGDGYNMFSSWIGDAAPHAPFRAVSRIRWRDINEQQLREHVDAYRYMPGVLEAAADWYEAHDQPEEAYALLVEASELVLDKKLSFRTAALSLQRGDQEQWLRLMLRVRDAPHDIPPSVDADLIIAHTYMQAGRWEEALPYAQAAQEAKPHHPIALLTLCWCHKAMGDLEDAMLAAYGFDREHATEFSYFFCMLWDLDEVRDQAVEFYRSEVLPVAQRRYERSHHSYEALRLLDAGEDEDSLVLMLQSWNRFKNANDAIRIVILAQKLGQTERRDQMLNTIINEKPNDFRAQIMADFCRLIFDAEDRVPPADQVAELLEGFNRQDSTVTTMLNLGWYLLVSGEEERGTRMLLDLVDLPGHDLLTYEKVMAVVVLRHAGYDIDHHDWQFSQAHTWPQP